MIVNKPWGHEKILLQTDNYVVKELHVRKNCRLSLQFHREKIETLFLLSGEGYIEVNAVNSRIDHFYSNDISVERYFPLPMEPVYINNGTIHRIGAGEADAVFLEVSTTQLDDVIRIEDDYKRQ